ncbi:MAG: GTP-binding protein [Oscillibacter sp.]|nr:GTP-binding protein [Oscillibacter sp.]
MEPLWEKKEYYKHFNPAKHSIADTCGMDYEDFIPYYRKYKKLSQSQLLDLIACAKTNRWQALDLSYCSLSELPDELWDLPDLQMLYLGSELSPLACEEETQVYEDNRIAFLPRNIERLENLQVLSLEGNHLMDTGGPPLSMKKLIHLDAARGGFSQFPDFLLIPTLQGLAFNCQERFLPENFVALTSLRELYLTHSKIIALPENIGALTQLKTLHLYDCNIRSLPASLSAISSLTNLELEETPLAQTIPPEILKQSAKEIISYYLKQQSNAPKQFFNESKMVIVGQGHVGKTCILNRLINNTYAENPSTEGIDISEWYFQDQNQGYKLNVWDFGGQEIYHSTHQFFLTERSLYLLVWDALAEEEYGRIDYWLKTIQSFAAESPIIIVVNKCDNDIGRIRRIDKEDYQSRFPQIKDVFYVSCKDDIRIGELRKYIESLAISLPLMKTTWLSSWMSVRQALEERSRHENFIPYQTYLEICASKDIGDDEALSLAKYLHDLGIILFYHDDPLLKNLVILSSEWGTDAVYKVLDEQEQLLKGRNGILRMEDLPKIWTDTTRYPQRLHPYLLNLMEKFQLTFRIHSTPPTYLVAELLDNKAIDLGWEFAYGKTLSFQYEYDFIPAGVMTRFIVAINPYLETIDGVKQCWRKGAYLRYKTAYALVRLYDNITDRYIQIKVGGDHPRDRRDLLTKIRMAFEDINGQFSKIQITERIPCICSKDCRFMFEFKTLLKAELKGRSTIICLDSLEDVSISKLLDGVELKMESQYGPIIFNNNPNFSNTTTVSTVSSVSNTVAVTTEVRGWICEMQGGLNDLTDELEEKLGSQSEELDAQLKKAAAALEKLEKSETKEDIQKSGAMNKIRRFLEECQDPESSTGKLLSGVKYAAGIVKDLAGKYNKIAKWVALPQLPFGDS